MLRINGSVRFSILRSMTNEMIKHFDLYEEFRIDMLMRLSLKNELDYVLCFDNIEDYPYEFLEYLAKELYNNPPEIQSVEFEDCDKSPCAIWLDVAYVVDVNVNEYFNKWEVK